MKTVITETVIDFDPKLFEAWKRGDKAKLLGGEEPPPAVYTQPNYHFGEYFTLDYFRRARWSGYRWYAIGEWEPNNTYYLEGRTRIEAIFPRERLSAFREQRRVSGYANGKGEPDLFLYMESGPVLFLEVKMGSDKISSAQLCCMAQINAILGADVGVVYLARIGQEYVPKSYELDLESFQGRELG